MPSLTRSLSIPSLRRWACQHRARLLWLALASLVAGFYVLPTGEAQQRVVRRAGCAGSGARPHLDEGPGDGVNDHHASPHAGAGRVAGVDAGPVAGGGAWLVADGAGRAERAPAAAVFHGCATGLPPRNQRRRGVAQGIGRGGGAIGDRERAQGGFLARPGRHTLSELDGLHRRAESSADRAVSMASLASRR